MKAAAQSTARSGAGLSRAAQQAMPWFSSALTAPEGQPWTGEEKPWEKPNA